MFILCVFYVLFLIKCGVVVCYTSEYIYWFHGKSKCPFWGCLHLLGAAHICIIHQSWQNSKVGVGLLTLFNSWVGGLFINLWTLWLEWTLLFSSERASGEPKKVQGGQCTTWWVFALTMAKEMPFLGVSVMCWAVCIVGGDWGVGNFSMDFGVGGCWNRWKLWWLLPCDKSNGS